MNRYGILFLLGAVFARVADCSAAEVRQPPVGKACLRITLTGDLYARTALEAEAVIDFEEILGAGRTLAASSLTMAGPATTESLPLGVSQDTSVRRPSGNPVLRLTWPAGNVLPLEEKSFVLTFSTVVAGATGAWQPLEKTFSRDGTLFASGFEVADPADPERPLHFAPAGQTPADARMGRHWTDETAHSGERSMRIARSSSSQSIWRSCPSCITVHEGAVYLVGGWIKSTWLLPGVQGSITIIYLNDTRGRLPTSESALVVRGPAKPSDWEYLSGSLAAPKDAAYAIIQLGIAGEGEVFFDDLDFRVVPGGTLPPLSLNLGEVEEHGSCLLP